MEGMGGKGVGILMVFFKNNLTNKKSIISISHEFWHNSSNSYKRHETFFWVI